MSCSWHRGHSKYCGWCETVSMRRGLQRWSSQCQPWVLASRDVTFSLCSVHSFSKHLLSRYFVSVTVLGTGNRRKNGNLAPPLENSSSPWADRQTDSCDRVSHPSSALCEAYGLSPGPKQGSAEVSHGRGVPRGWEKSPRAARVCFALLLLSLLWLVPHCRISDLSRILVN